MKWGGGRTRDGCRVEATWVPLGNTIRTILVSQQLGNYQFQPYWGELYDQMWVR